MSNFDGSRNLQINNLNCVNTMTAANLRANNFTYGGTEFLTLLSQTNENQTNTNFLCTNLTAGTIISNNITTSSILVSGGNIVIGLTTGAGVPIGNPLAVNTPTNTTGTVFGNAQSSTTASILTVNRFGVSTILNVRANARVGINTTSPNEALDVRGNLQIGNSTAANYISFIGTSGDNNPQGQFTYIGERIYGGTEQSELLLFKGNDASSVSGGPDRIRMLGGELVFQTINAGATGLSGTFDAIGTSTSVGTIMLITSSGNVGISTTAPSFRLDVNGSGRITNLQCTNSTIDNVFTTNISTSNIRIADNGFISADSDFTSRLSLIKKSGSPPAISISNNAQLLFQVASTTNASLVSSNSYSNIMTLTTAGTLSLNDVNQLLPRLNTSGTRNNTFVISNISGNIVSTITTDLTGGSNAICPLAGIGGAITTSYSGGNRWDVSSGTSPLWRTPTPGLYQLHYSGCTNTYGSAGVLLNFDLFDTTTGTTRSSLQTIDVSRERLFNLNVLFTSGNHTNNYVCRTWLSSGTIGCSQTSFSLRVIERW